MYGQIIQLPCIMSLPGCYDIAQVKIYCPRFGQSLCLCVKLLQATLTCSMRSTAGVTGVSSIAAPLPLCEGVTGTKLSDEAAVEATALLSAALLSLLPADDAAVVSSAAAESLSLERDLAAGAAAVASEAAEAAAISVAQPAGVVAPREAWLMRGGLVTC